MSETNMTRLRRLAAIETDQCTLWPFAGTTKGYAAIYVGGRGSKRQLRGHRLVCEWVHGAPPFDGAVAAHLCGNRLCVNPRHIAWATVGENNRHKEGHGTLLYGEYGPSARLTEDQVQEIRRRYSDGGTTHVRLADEYGVHPTTDPYDCPWSQLETPGDLRDDVGSTPMILSTEVLPGEGWYAIAKRLGGSQANQAVKDRNANYLAAANGSKDVSGALYPDMIVWYNTDKLVMAVIPAPEPPEEPAPEPPADPGFIEGWGVPAWRDEFEGPNIDTSKWTVWNRAQHGSLSFDWGILTPENVFIEDSQLHMRISRRTASATSGGKVRWWDTAMIDANGKFNTGFGRWEMRAKTTASRVNSTGMWCAFWLRNAPDQGEIDIMESWGNPTTARTRPANTVDTSTLSLHENTSGTGLSSGRGWEEKAGLPSPYTTSAGFHVWTIEFTPTSFKGFFDGKLAMNATRDGAGGTEAHPWIWGSTFDSPTWYPRLNHAMGDPYWSPDPDHNNAAIVTPRDFIVDYVRYWAMPV